MSATASSSPTKQSSPTAQPHLPSELHDMPQHPEAAPNKNGPREGAGAGAEAVSDDGDDSAAVPVTVAPQVEDGTAPKAKTDPDHASAETGVEEEEGEDTPDTADELPGTTDGVDGGGQGEQQAAAIKGKAPTAGESEEAEADSIAPASEAAEPDDEHGGLGAGAKEEPGRELGEVSNESDDGGVGSGAKAEADAEGNARKAVDVGVEVDGATSAAGETTRGDGVDKPGTAAATETPEREAISGSDVVGGGGVLSAGVAEDFFAGDNSSGDYELSPGAAAAATAGGAAGAGTSALATHLSGSDQDREPPVSAQPPSPRIIASSVQGGFRSPVATQRNEAAATKGEGGLSEAAKAAVAAALANAASATSRRGDDGSKPRKKKSSHRERRRKRSGSRSAGEEDSGVGSRGSGSIGRPEVNGGGGGRSKRSSSRRHHRKSAVG